MDSAPVSKIGLAILASIGIHLFVLVVAEVASKPQKPTHAPAPPVEISRVTADGTNMPDGKGTASFNSRPSIASPGFGEKYNLDAGVPSNIPVPPRQNQPQTASSPQTQSQNQADQRSPATGNFPVYQGSASLPNRQNLPPQNQRQPDTNSNVDGNTPPSTPSQAASAGNQGKTRSRGPNRIAFPEFTVEPQVPVAMVTGSVMSSVDVSVDIAADGTHSERIVRSSGSAEVDDLVLAALKQWKWDPAARDGNPIASTQNFKFNFKPR